MWPQIDVVHGVPHVKQKWLQASISIYTSIYIKKNQKKYDA
jgi:hypothetical protein